MEKHDFQSTIKKYQNRIDNNLSKLLNKDTQSTLAEAMRYSVINGGKRLRPILVYLAAELTSLKVNEQSKDDLASAVELMHCYSLIHDDLPAMDNDDLRRGMPTSHIAFDEATAILAGDALQPLAYEIILNSPFIENENKIYILKKLSKACGFRGMVEGQMLDILSNSRHPTIKDLDLMHNLKTGELIKTSLVIGGKLAKYNEEELKNIEKFGAKIGLAFQITDDIIDIESPSEISGKNQGSDILGDKITYPSLIGVKKAKKRAKKLVQEAIEYLSIFTEDTSHLKELGYFIIEREA
ncbi:MAG: polyprenyl synthetase family protein [SAR86 cluster bacterium]|jgi:farnesyl diphosphate synthase|nr:polyprenyl synthetase family protein [SAR86 cluster bacterium]